MQTRNEVQIFTGKPEDRFTNVAKRLNSGSAKRSGNEFSTFS